MRFNRILNIIFTLLMILRKLSIWVSFCVSNLPGCLKLHRLELPLVKLGFQCVHAGSVKRTLQICMVTPFLEQRWFAGPWSKLFAFAFVWFSRDMNIYSVGEKSFALKTIWSSKPGSQPDPNPKMPSLSPSVSPRVTQTWQLFALCSMGSQSAWAVFWVREAQVGH